jgi:lipopolysaccharide heptosyltransferase II
MKPLPARRQKILVIKTQAIGDVLLTTPSIRALRRLYPDAHITAVVGEWSRDALVGNPHLDEVISYEDEHFLRFRIRKILKLITALRREQFDKIFMFHPSGYIHFLGLLLGSSQRIGFIRDNSGFSLTKKIPWTKNGHHEYVAETYLKLVPNSGTDRTEDVSMDFVIPEKARDGIDRMLSKADIPSAAPFVAIAPGGGKNPRDTVYAKRWKAENFARLADEITAAYGLKTVLLGSLDDRTVVDRVLALTSSAPVDFCCRTDLKELGACIERASLLITNDSAPLHIGVALSTQTISLFGPSDPRLLLPRDRKHIAIRSRTDCSPCYTNNLFPGCADCFCMDRISVEEVLAAVERQLHPKILEKNVPSS